MPMSKALHSALSKVAAETPTDGILRLCDLIHNDARFANIDPKLIADEIRNFADTGRGPITDTKIAADKLFDLLSPNAEWVPPSPKSADVLVNPVKRHVGAATSKQWQSLTTNEKTWTGLAFLTAGISAVGAWSNASKAIAKDENGERHLKPSLVGLAILDTVFAVAGASLGLAMLRNGSSR
jgi:hypothetical protein